jgi:LacI family transcriptional regulator
MANTQLKDIAKKLGMSISTVSRAIRNIDEVSPQTRLLVKEMAELLNYRPNPHARSLRIKKTKTVAVLVPDISNNFFAHALKGIETALHKEGFNLMIYQTNDSFEIENKILYELETGLVDGVLLSASLNEEKDFTHVEDLRRSLPVVFFDRFIPGSPAPRVISDNVKGTCEATKHLLQTGSRSVYFIGIDPSISLIADRLTGFKKAMKEAKIETDPDKILYFRDIDTAYNQLTKILSRAKEPVAFFSSVERYALQLYKICDELKLNIPKDVKVITYSNNPYTSLFSTKLSVIVPPAFEIGNRAAAILLNLINEKKVGKQEVVLPCTVTLEQSSAGS